MTALAETYEDLDVYLNDCGEDGEPDFDEPPPPLPDAEAVNRSVGKLARVRRRKAEYEEIAQAEIERVREWLADRVAKLEPQQEWRLEQLRHYHEAVLADDPSRKTLHFPNGDLQSRKAQPRWVIDDAVFVEWAQGHGRADLLNVKPPPPAKGEIKKALQPGPKGEDGVAVVVDAEGEIVPGVTVDVSVERTYDVDTTREVES